MGKTTIKFSLDPADIDRAIREVKAYQQDFSRKVEIFRKRIGDEIAKEAQTIFNSSIIDDLVKGSPKKPEVTVTVSSTGNVTIVVAEGEDAVWCEFGAGVYHNGAVGSSPNPFAVNTSPPLTIGSYGKGRGKQQAWGYYEDGEVKITRGTPATMPLYNAVTTVTKKAVEIAKEVWG